MIGRILSISSLANLCCLKLLDVVHHGHPSLDESLRIFVLAARGKRRYPEVSSFRHCMAVAVPHPSLLPQLLSHIAGFVAC